MAGWNQRGDSESESDFGGPEGFNALALSDDPRTISEIKRSRIDLDRRYVFLCPTSLSKHFDVLPQQAKDSALLVFKCSREWLVRDPKDGRRNRVQSRTECGQPKNAKNKRPGASGSSAGVLSASARQSEFTKGFMQWVTTKEKEGCIFWWKPEKDFQKLSKFLEEKTDPVSEQPYRPLLLDPHWWRVHFSRTTARFCNNPAHVVANISERSNAGVDKRDVALHVLQELIFQSNPTLEPITKWPYAPSMRFLPKVAANAKDFVGQYASFKGYIDNSTLRSMDSTARAQEITRISHWPAAARERRDDLHQSWHRDDVLARRNLPNVASPRSAPPTVREGGGLFGSALGFGQGNIHLLRRSTADAARSPRRHEEGAPPGSSQSAR